MPQTRTQTPRIVDLAERLVADIESRHLQPGDRYLTVTAASRMLGVGNGVANRALQLLERRNVIIRQQRSGAYIATLPRETPLASLDRVHFLVHQNYLAAEGVGSDQILLGMQEELPGALVQISFLPSSGAAIYVSRLIDQSLASKSREGFILVRAPFEVHQLASDRGVPCVVYGGLYPGIHGLSRIDRDMAGVGAAAADYLIARGHTRLAFLSRQSSMPGDHDTMDAIRESLTEHHLLADSITERFLPSEELVSEAEVLRLLDSRTPPTGFICRAKRMADGAISAFKKRNLQLSKEVDLVLCDYHLSAGQRPSYVYPRPVYSLEEQGRHIARLLVARAKGEPCMIEIIPVEMDSSAASS